MRYFYLFLIIIESANSSGDLPRVQRIHPEGFRITVPYVKPYDVPSMKIYGTINKKIQLGAFDTEYDFYEIKAQLKNGYWVYDNVNRNTPAGTLISYIINPPNEVRTAILTEDSVSIANKNPHEAFLQKNCKPSLTTVNRRQVCEGELIFEENFDTLNSTIWQNEVRIPLENEGSPFVSYQNRPENCYIQNGQLNIVPTLLSDNPGFNESYIRNGELHLDDCTALDDESKECHKKAHNFNILPPIVSARIHTKHSFSFRYGKIVIRVKMPRGDWVVPLIQLDPLENYYGHTNYASGQVRLVYMRANENLLDRDDIDISRRRIQYGPVFSNQYPAVIRLFPYSAGYYLDDFRIFTFIWSSDDLSFSSEELIYPTVIKPPFIDSMCLFYNLAHCRRWKKHGTMPPFDREFYLTLGISVGGHFDFPQGCKNGRMLQPKPWNNYDPKAELNFWKDRNNWIDTWKGDNTGLQIDSIKVYAL